MSSFGVLDTGFRAKDIDTIVTELEAAFRASSEFGPQINTQADSVLGQIIRILADQIADLYQANLAVYTSFNPAFASGAALDSIAAITGVQRLPASGSRAILTLVLDDGVTVPAGSLVAIGSGGLQFETQASVSNSSGFRSVFTVEAVATTTGALAGNAGTVDTIITPVSGWSSSPLLETIESPGSFVLADGQTLVISVDGGADQTATFNTADFGMGPGDAQASEIAAVINTDISGVTATAVNGAVQIRSDATSTGSSLKISETSTANVGLGFPLNEAVGFNRSTNATTENGQVGPYALSDGQVLSLRVDGGSTQIVTFNTGDFSNIAAATSNEVATVINANTTGLYASASGNQLQIQSLTSGSTSLIEVVGGDSNGALGFQEQEFGGTSGDATLGRDLETDFELRQRRLTLLTTSGSRTLAAIKAAVLLVEGVTQVTAFENETDVTDAQGRPPHSIELIVLGGEDADIAAAILSTKAAGIQTYRDPGANGVTVSTTDIEGNAVDINFSRPTEVPIFVEADITVNATTFGSGTQSVGQQIVREAIRDEGITLLTGEDVIAIRLQCAPLEAAGVIDVTALRLGTTASPVNTANLTIADREQATFSTANIVVNVTVV